MNAVSRSAPSRNAIRSIACICVTDSAGAMPWPVASPSTISTPWSMTARSKVSPPVRLAGRERAEEVVAGKRGHGGRQRAHLDDARHFELLAHLLAFDHRLRHAHALQRDRALRRQHRRQRLVVFVEDAVRLVQDLHHADEDVLVIDQRQREHAARPVVGLPVHVAG